MLKSYNRKKDFIIKNHKLKKKKKEIIEKSEENEFDMFSKKEVKNLDYFKTFKYKKPNYKENRINFNYKSNNFESINSIKDLPKYLDSKIKNLVDELNILKRNKFDIIKIHNYINIVSFFNKNNKKYFIKFKEINNIFIKIKNKENSEINNNISMLNELNYKKDNLDNKLNYLKNSYEFNNNKLNDLIEKKHLHETKNKELIKNENSKNLKRRSVFLTSNRNNPLEYNNNSKLDLKKIVKKETISKPKNNSNYSKISKKLSINSSKRSINKIKLVKKNSQTSSSKNSSLSSMESDLRKSRNSKFSKKSKNSFIKKNLINQQNNVSQRIISKRQVLNDFSIINIDIINFNNKNISINKDIQKYKLKEVEINNKIKELDIDVKYRNNLMNVINKLDKKFNKNLIIFIKDEIEFGYDIKSNGIIWLYFELIKLNHFKLDIYPNFLNEKYKIYLKKLVDNFILIFKQNNRLSNIKVFNKLLINNNTKEENYDITENTRPLYFQETEKIKINNNLYNFKKNFYSNNNKTNEINYICDQNYKLPNINKNHKKNNFYTFGKNMINEKIIKNKNITKNNENNFNIKFIDDNNIIDFVNIKTMNLEKKNIFKDIKIKFNSIELLIKESKRKFIKNYFQLSKTYGLEKIYKITCCLHGIYFSSQIHKEK